MTEKLSVQYISADDWCGVYLNGRLYEEGHSLPPRVWMTLLNEAGVDILDDGETSEAYSAIQERGACPLTWPVQAGGEIEP